MFISSNIYSKWFKQSNYAWVLTSIWTSVTSTINAVSNPPNYCMMFDPIKWQSSQTHGNSNTKYPHIIYVYWQDQSKHPKPLKYIYKHFANAAHVVGRPLFTYLELLPLNFYSCDLINLPSYVVDHCSLHLRTTHLILRIYRINRRFCFLSNVPSNSSSSLLSGLRFFFFIFQSIYHDWSHFLMNVNFRDNSRTE